MQCWAIDTEYGYRDAARDCESAWKPVVFCAVEADSGECFHAWGDDPDLGRWIHDHQASLFIAHNAPAEMKYLIRLGLPLPANWFDTRLAWRFLSNSPQRRPAALEQVLKSCGLQKWVPRAKKELQESIGNLRFDGSSPEELRRIMSYCYADCQACRLLYLRFRHRVPTQYMDYWSRFLAATSRMELRGIPIDTGTYGRILEQWPGILADFALDANRVCPGAYDGATLKHGRLVEWCRANGIDWPVKESPATGRLYCPRDDDTYRDMATRHPLIAHVRETEKAKKAFGKRKMVVDEKLGRHFYSSVTFGAITGRNTNPQFIFSGPKWMRHLMRAEEPERLLVYVDFVAQEFAVAAGLSDDTGMVETYQATDCHMEFAVRAGAAPVGATKSTHPSVRKLYKTCNLGTLYGQSARGLADRLGVEYGKARSILDDHRRLYPKFWEWSERVVEGAYSRGAINTRCGWRMKVPADTRDTVLMNWPMQSHGGDVMRLAVIYLDRQNVRLLAPIHDGFLLTCRRDQLADLREAVDFALRTAVNHVLPDFPMRWEFTVYPNRFEDEDGAEQWNQICSHLRQHVACS